MIRSSYIHEYADLDEFLNLVEESNDEISSAVSLYNSELESRRINAFVESTGVDIYEEGVVNVVEKIGKAVESIIKKFTDLVDKIVTTVREKLWSRKSDIEKAEALAKKYPKWANDIKVAINNGDLDVKDINSMKDVVDGTYDILDKINKGKIKEPSKAEKMFDDVLDKFNRYGKPICDTIKIVGGAIGGFLTIKQLHAKLMQNKFDTADMKNQLERVKNQTVKEYRETHGGKAPVMMELKFKIFNKLSTTLSSNTTKLGKLSGKVGDAIADFLKKHDGKDIGTDGRGEALAKKANFFNSVKTGKSEPKHDDDELEWERRKAQAQEAGRRASQPQQHTDEELAWEKRKAQAQEAGRRADRDSFAGRNSSRNTARAQQFGKNQADEFFKNNGRSGRNNKGWRNHQ